MGGIGNSTVGRRVSGPCYMKKKPAHHNTTKTVWGNQAWAMET